METEASEYIVGGNLNRTSLAKMGDNNPREFLSSSWFTWLAPGLVGAESLETVA